MFAMKLSDAKRAFFDRARVINATTVAERQVLSRFGAYVRQRARTSIKARKAASRPGSPPSSHVGLLKQFILFAYDSTRASVVIGPMRLNAKAGDAPRLLEYGGSALRPKFGKLVRCQYQPRPFMHPAFDRELPHLPPLWRDSIR